MEWTAVARWVIGGVALALGAFVAIANWITLINVTIHKGTSSFVPFLGGALAFLGLVVLPFPGRLPWLWVPFVADWGCLPMWSVVGISVVGGKRKRKGSGEHHAGKSSSGSVSSDGSSD